jgi:hypothetical protein
MKLLVSFLIILFVIPSSATVAQNKINVAVADTSFPESWDRKQKFRENVYNVLAWVHQKDESGYEYRSCLVIFESVDSLGRPEYFLSQHYTNKKPFKKWNYSSIHYGGGYFTASGIEVGYHDLHLEIYDHKPTQKEVYELINKWEFKFYKKDWITVEAGLDSVLWQAILGFKPDSEFNLK